MSVGAGRDVVRDFGRWRVQGTWAQGWLMREIARGIGEVWSPCVSRDVRRCAE